MIDQYEQMRTSNPRLVTTVKKGRFTVRDANRGEGEGGYS